MEKSKADTNIHWALMALSRIFTDRFKSTLAPGLDDPAEKYYREWEKYSLFKRICLLILFLGSAVTATAYFVYHNTGGSIFFGVMTLAFTVLSCAQIPKYPGHNVVAIAKSWSAVRSRAMQTGIIFQLARELGANQCILEYIKNGMSESLSSQPIAVSLAGRSWKMIHDAIGSCAESPRLDHKAAYAAGLPRDAKKALIQYGDISLLARDLGFEPLPELHPA